MQEQMLANMPSNHKSCWKPESCGRLNRKAKATVHGCETGTDKQRSDVGQSCQVNFLPKWKALDTHPPAAEKCTKQSYLNFNRQSDAATNNFSFRNAARRQSNRIELLIS